MKTNYKFDYYNGVAICRIYKKGQLVGCGQAECHSDDKDMESERVGCFIAETRANIDYMTNKRNRELIPGLHALEHLYACIKNSKNYNPKSYEAIMIKKQIIAKKREIAMINDDIKMEKEYLKDYINNKDIMYKRIRKGKNN